MFMFISMEYNDYIMMIHAGSDGEGWLLMVIVMVDDET